MARRRWRNGCDQTAVTKRRWPYRSGEISRWVTQRRNDRVSRETHCHAISAATLDLRWTSRLRSPTPVSELGFRLRLQPSAPDFGVRLRCQASVSGFGPWKSRTSGLGTPASDLRPRTSEISPNRSRPDLTFTGYFFRIMAVDPSKANAGRREFDSTGE